MDQRFFALFCFVQLILGAFAETTTSPERRCIDGKRYNDGCNDCSCGNGNTRCTLKLCSYYDEKLKEYKPLPPRDPPADYWEEENVFPDATTSPDGTASQPARRCADRKNYNDGCNQCFCLGGKVSCTRKFCGKYDEETEKFVPMVLKDPPADFWEPSTA